MPGAISAKLVYPERRVLAICGDGGFMMNCPVDYGENTKLTAHLEQVMKEL